MSPITIYVPNNNLQERLYIVKTFFDVFVGIQSEIKTFEEDYSLICLSNNKSIRIADALWSRYRENSAYLVPDALPKVIYSSNIYTPEADIPVLYGDGAIELKADQILCGIDVFASSFFMLTRWEEYVCPQLDSYQRYIGTQSIAYLNNFLFRPLVNEYAEMVWNMLKALGYEGARNDRKFEVVATHDVDHPYLELRILRTIKYVLKDILIKDFTSSLIRLKDFFRDPYDTFDFLMTTSEDAGIKSHFYLMAADASTTVSKPSKAIGSKQLKRIVSMIQNRGHIIGFHPGVFSYKDPCEWTSEKEIVDDYLGRPVKEGRQHYLMMSIPDTLSIWENSDMEIDSTLAYADVEGFRCGTGDIFPYFNFLERKEYRLKERPLILQEGTLVTYRKYPVESVAERMKSYFEIGEKYKMPITILFHNSSFSGRKGFQLRKQYIKALKNIKH